MEASPNVSAERMLDASPDTILLVDDDGKITYANDRVRTEFGYDPDELVGDRIERLVPDASSEAHVSHRQTYMEDPTRRPMGVGLDLEAKQRDGTTIPVEVSLSPLQTDDDVHVVVAIRDISKRQQYHEQVTRLREATRQLMDAETKERIAELVAIAARDIFAFEGCVSRITDGDQHLNPVAVVGGDSVGIEDRPDYAIDGGNPVAKTYRTGEPQIYDDVQTLDDEFDRGDSRAAMYVPISEYGVLSILDREPNAFNSADLELATNLATNAETILDRIRHERELERQIDRLDEFASVVSHDLRNPLNVAQLRLDFAAEAIDDELEGDHVDSIVEALDRMEDIVEDTLTLARQGNVVGETEPVAVRPMVEQCWDRIDTDEATLELIDDFSISADPGRLEHVFENVLSNAIMHGGPSVTVRIDRLRDDTGFYIEDNGAGLPAEERDRIFQTGNTTADDGTGFGLAIVRQIAESHGWTVTATTASSGGARFEFSEVTFATNNQ